MILLLVIALCGCAAPVPETTVPVTTIPETTVPETTIPEIPVPETPVPETTIPETTAPTEPLHSELYREGLDIEQVYMGDPSVEDIQQQKKLYS